MNTSDIFLLKTIYKFMDREEDDIKFKSLLCFNKKYSSLIKNNKTKITGINPIIPVHILEKYGSQIKSSKGEKSLFIKIKDLFTKISISNHEEITKQFLELNLNDHIYDEEDIPKKIYEIFIDIIYLIDATIYLLLAIKKNNIDIFNKIIHLCTHYSDEYLHMTDEKKMKLWRINNSILLSNLYNYGLINIEQINKIVHTYLTNKDEIYITLIYNIYNNLKIKQEDKNYDYIDSMYESLELLSLSKDYSLKTKLDINNILAIIEDY